MPLVTLGISPDARPGAVLLRTFFPNSSIKIRTPHLAGFRSDIEIAVPPRLFGYGRINRILVVPLIMLPLDRPIKNLMMNTAPLIHFFGQRMMILIIPGPEDIGGGAIFIFKVFLVGGLPLLVISGKWIAAYLL